MKAKTQDKEDIPSEQPLQIFAKTLNFGTITLEVKASDTIKHVKRKTRAKLEHMLEGFDVNMMVNFEDDMVFEGKQLDDERTLSDYTIQKEATLRFVHGLEGGMPRGGSRTPRAGGSSRATKKEQMKTLRDEMEFVTLRLVAKNIQNPTIQECVTNMNTLFRIADNNEKENVKLALSALNVKDLETLLGVTSVSTKPIDRAKVVGEVLFKRSFEMLGEIARQCDDAEKMLPKGILYMMMGIFGDESANIAWSGFTNLVGQVMTEIAVEAATAQAERGLGI